MSSKLPKELEGLLKALGVNRDDVKVGFIGPDGVRESSLEEMTAALSAATEKREDKGRILSQEHRDFVRGALVDVTSNDKDDDGYYVRMKEIGRITEYHLGVDGNVTNSISALVAVLAVLVAADIQVLGLDKNQKDDILHELLSTLAKGIETVPFKKKFNGETIMKKGN